MPSVMLGEKIYFLNQNQREVCVIRFDTKTEKLTKIGELLFKQKPVSLSFIVEGGRIRLYVLHVSIDHENEIELLRMNRDGDWSMAETYPACFNVFLRPLHLMSNGNWLMHFGCSLYTTDTNKDTNGNGSDRLNTVGMHIAEEGKYIGTFVSPNRYM